MNSASKTAGMAILGVVVIISLFRLIGSGDSGTTDREVSRLFVCELCGALHPVSPELIREQYDAGTVKNGNGGPRFVCKGCEKPGARVEVLDFDTDVVRCESCGETLIEDVSDAMSAADRGNATTDDKGRLTFKCDECDSFTGVMAPRHAPVDIEEEEE